MSEYVYRAAALLSVLLILLTGCARPPEADTGLTGTADIGTGPARPEWQTESTKVSEDSGMEGPEVNTDIYGKDYDFTKDPFYERDRIFVTWLNVWNGSTEFRWSGLSKTTSVNGIKADINDSYVCLDSNNRRKLYGAGSSEPARYIQKPRENKRKSSIHNSSPL